MNSQNGRKILVTGAAGGLGSALCGDLIRAGATVIATDVNGDKLNELERSVGANGSLHIELVDQSDRSAIGRLADELVKRHGGIDVLINNAAIYPKGIVEEQPIDVAAQVLDTNLVAAMAFTKACVPSMRAKGSGRIVNVASITFDIGFTELGAYVASKGGLIGLTRVWARELGQYGITVNAISPGAFQTDAEKIHPDPEGYSRFVLDRQCVKRRGSPADFVNLVSFLISDDSGFITGQTIRVDGGWIVQ